MIRALSATFVGRSINTGHGFYDDVDCLSSMVQQCMGGIGAVFLGVHMLSSVGLHLVI